VARYVSYLLRVWQISRDDGVQWSCRLEHLQDGGYTQFLDVEALLAHLRVALAPQASGGPVQTGAQVALEPDQGSPRGQGEAADQSASDGGSTLGVQGN
jgi:hypothetical protein